MAAWINAIERCCSLRNSSSARVGRMSMSATSSIMSSASRDRKSAVTVNDSFAAPEPIAPPTAAAASAKTAASPLPAPFSSSAASSEAMPARSTGSAAVPPRTAACRPTRGTSCFSASAAPARLVVAIDRDEAGLPGLLAERKPVDGETVAYRCVGTHCELPVNTLEKLGG